MRQSKVQSIIQRRLLGIAIATSLTPTILVSPSFALSISPQALSQINAALNYPNASQRFFEEGQERFEDEVQQLQEPATNATEPLQVDEDLPDTLNQQRLQLEQPDERSHDRRESGSL
ncbi:MAG: hypothetical protein SFY66_29230 [Oculatellaceae cyanobacterium bins.114]|nr:hypothetical protein [Oculatellaceae cyanobacterium bins.114]